MKSFWRATLAIAFCITAIAVGGEWLYFRATHVVAAYAFVKGGVVEAGAPIDGQVISVEVTSGQRVEAGDVLVRFNDVRERAALSRAQAALEEARREVAVEQAQLRLLYEEVKVSSGQALAAVQVSRAEARVASIDADLADAQARRTRALRVQDMVPEEQSEASAAAARIASSKAEQARGKVAVAEAQLGGARLQYARTNAREARLELLLAAVATAEAQVRSVEAELELCIVRAAYTGVISRRLVEPGSAVRVGGPLIEVWYDDALTLEAWIDESEYGSLDPKARAQATFPGLSGPGLTGRLEWLGVVTESELKNASFSIPIAKKLAQSRWVRSKVVLDRVDPRLLPGLTANVSVPRASPQAKARPSAWPIREAVGQVSKGETPDHSKGVSLCRLMRRLDPRTVTNS